MTSKDPRAGILLMIFTMFVFAMQDGISRYLADAYNVLTVVMFRYWFFAAFVLARSAALPGGIARVARTSQLWLQIIRGLMLATEICVMILAFTLLGLVEAHALFAAYPLMIAALSGPLLGETVGWRRWTAIGIGFLGILIILRPGFQVFSLDALVALAAATGMAIYSLLTRYAARRDSAETSFFYTGIVGAVAITCVAPFWWEPMQTPRDWGWMGVLCLTGALGHFTLIKVYEIAEAGSVQPFAYFQLVFGAALGVLVFQDVLEWPVMLGTGIVIAAGLFTFWREQVKARSATSETTE